MAKTPPQLIEDAKTAISLIAGLAGRCTESDLRNSLLGNHRSVVTLPRRWRGISGGWAWQDIEAALERKTKEDR